MSHIPAGSLVRRPRGGRALNFFITAGHSGAGVVEFLASSGEVVFFVADHSG